jgi:DNA repair exonuclease SbcCD ATPase subunit
MDRRLFGPKSLRYLRKELAHVKSSETESQHRDELERLQAEREKIDQSMRRQTLRMEEQDDPRHPIIVLAKQRIDELAIQREAVREAIRALEAKQTASSTSEEIEAALQLVPDLRRTLKTADPEELADILAAFEITITYDKTNQTLSIAATINPEISTATSKTRSARKQSRMGPIAGEAPGLRPAVKPRIEEVVESRS